MIFVYIFIIGLPVILIFFIGKKIREAGNIQRHGVKTHAVITHITLQHFSKNSFAKIMLEYKDNAGTYYAANATTIPGQYKIGDRMPLTYLPDKPSDYAIDGVKQGNWVILVFCILLLLFTIFASYKIDEMVQSGNY